MVYEGTTYNFYDLLRLVSKAIFLLFFISSNHLIGFPSSKGQLTVLISHITFSVAFVAIILEALEKSNENTGGAYIEKNSNAYYIRSEGLAKSLDDIGKIVVSDRGNIPVLISDIATVQYGKAPRYGALVRNGAEVVP